MIANFIPIVFAASAMALLLKSKKNYMVIYSFGFVLWSLEFVFDVPSKLFGFFAVNGSFFILMSLLVVLRGDIYD